MSQLVSFFKASLAICLTGLVLVCHSSGAAETVAGLQDYPRVSNISQFRNIINRAEARVCVFELHGTVLAVDAAANIIFLQDDTALEVLQMNFQGTLQPGQKIHLWGTNYVVRTDYGLSFGKHPVVENDGLHSRLEREGTVFLQAGRHPLLISWFNYTVDSFLELSWLGPAGGRVRIPEAALFRRESQPGDAGQSFVPGLNFRCFEGLGQRLFDFENLHPVKTGSVSHLDVNVKTRNEHVALEFTGFLDVPTNGVYTFYLDSDDGSRFFLDDAPPRVAVVGAEPVPSPRPVAPGELLAAGQASFWGQVTGTITYLSRQQNGAEMELGSDANGLRVKIMNSRDGLPIHLLRSRVRVTGICLNTRNADGQPGVALLTAPNWESVQVLEAAPDHWTTLSSVKLTELPAIRQTDTDAVIHAVGRLSARAPEGLMALEEGTNFVFLQLLNPFASKVGDQVECLGRWGRHGTNLVLREAVVRSLAQAREEPQEKPLPLLTTAAQVQQLKREEARRGFPVRLRGVVTWVSDHHEALVIQDSTRAVFVTIGSVWKSNMPVPGEYLEIEEASDPADFSPIVKMTKVTRLGVGRMPTPVSPTLEQMINGSLDAQYVEISGFVTGVQSNTVTLFTRTGPIELNVTLNSSEPLAPYLHAMIRLRGPLFANWDPITHQVIPNLPPLLKSASLQVDVPASVDPFRVQPMAAAELLQFNVQPETFRRVRISAQILQAGGSIYYAMDGGIGVRIQPTQPVEIAPGAIVDIVGFADVGGVTPILREAILRKTGQAQLPAARKLDLSALNGQVPIRRGFGWKDYWST
ncbi:MAG: PA14 domain-containing protein [Verrucomicrobiota bacterium]